VATERRIEAGLGVVAWVENEAGQSVEIRVGERELVDAGASSLAMKDERREPAPTREEILLRQGYGGQVASRPAPAKEVAGKEIFVFVDGAPAATVELAETWREGLDEVLRELPALGVGVEILTGDASALAGRFTGAIVRAGLTPADKHIRVRELVAAGRRVAFVGDGINDAAAMSAAQASIAMQAGAELARAAAMAVFAGDDLRFLPRAIRVARAARRSIRTNLQFAAAYNTAGMALAAAGALHPVVAALLMVGSSAFVSVNALRSSAAGNPST
jgi:cation transport ATPase